MPVQIPPVGSYVLDPARTSITFHTRHMFGTGKVTGTFALRSGRIDIANQPSASTAFAEIDSASFKTANAKRDKSVAQPNLLDSANFPVMTFKSTGVKPVGGGWVLSGDLEVRGTSAPVEFVITEAQALAGGGTVQISATCVIDRYAHGITAGKGMIARRLRIELKSIATRVAS